MSFLTEFVNALPLHDNDRAQLKRERGFTDETIDKLRLKSLGAHVKDLIVDMDPKFLNVHKIVNDEGFINGQLTSPRILIPYISASGIVTKIRPHKLGFKGDGIEPYCDLIFDRDRTDGILCEGEFKAASGYQLGLNCIAAPGIGVFSRDHFDELVAFLKESQLKSLIILFDQEIKDDPAFKNFKPEWRNRHDTPIYSYIMGKKLEQCELHLNVKIAELPREWMIDGKADIDGALANGKTREDFDRILEGAMTPEKYRNMVCKREEKKVGTYIRKRTEKFMFEPNIRRNFNRYEFKKKIKNSEMTIWEPISNFVLDIVSKYYDEEENEEVRYVVIRNGMITTKPVRMISDFMNSKSTFLKFLLSRGDFIYSGTDKQLLELWELEFLYSDGDKVIVNTDHVGKVDNKNLKDYDMWLFGNVAFCGDQEIFPDSEGRYWINETTGVKHKEYPGVRVPILQLSEPDLPGIKRCFQDMAGHNGSLLLGWAAYSLLAPYIGLDDIHPFPFLYGEKGGGKTTIAKAAMGLFGLYGHGSAITDITKVALVRLLSYYSEIPFWLDEYHNSKAMKFLEADLKSIYNRESRFRGSKRAGEIIAYILRSGLLFSGETIPMTDGVKQRSMLMHTSIQEHGDRGMEYLVDNKENLSAFTYHVVKNRVKLAAECKTYIIDFREAILKFRGGDIEERLLRHTSYFYGCYRALFGRDATFNEWLNDTFIKESTEIVQEDEIETMFNDFMVLKNLRKIDDGFACRKTSGGQDVIAFWLNGFYEVWRKEFISVSDKEIHSKVAIKRSLDFRPYYAGTGQVRLGGTKKRVVLLDYATAPETIRAVVDSTDLVSMEDDQLNFKGVNDADIG